MGFMIRLGLLASLALAIGLCFSSRLRNAPPDRTETESGLVNGTVLYEDGRPVHGATVFASPIGRPIGAIIPHSNSDETGHFAIRVPGSWFGGFAVAAKKEDEDYPDMSRQFYSDGKFQTVTLTTLNPTATVTIRLGPKAGVLIGTVADAVTGAPLSPCVEFKRALEPNNSLSASGLVEPKYRLLIPSNTGILIKIWLDGYRAWYYPGELPSRTLSLLPAEEKTVDVRLQPDSAFGDSGCPSH
jgi:hypothetical protein